MEEPNMTNAERVEMYLKAIADTLKGETPELDGYTYTKMEEWLAYIITVLQENGGGSGSGGTTNYNQLTNKPITNMEGTETSPIYLRELETGAYILNGTCSPYNGSETYMGANNAVTFVNHFDTVTAIQIFYPPYNQVQYYEVYDDTYTTNTVRLNDLPTKEYVDNAVANVGGSNVPIYQLSITNTNIPELGTAIANQSDLAEIINDAYAKGYSKICINVITGLGSSHNIFFDSMNADIQKKPTSFNFIKIQQESNRYLTNALLTGVSYQLGISLEWAEDVCTVTRANIYRSICQLISTTNTATYTPTSNYHPATKKYVDDAINGINVNVSVEEKASINPCLYFDLGSYMSITESNLTQDTIQTDTDGNDIYYSDLMPMLDTIITNYLNNTGGILLLKPYYEELLPFKVNWATETDALMTSFNIFKGEDGNLYTANIRIQGTYDETTGFTTTSFTIKSYADTTIATKTYVDTAIANALSSS